MRSGFVQLTWRHALLELQAQALDHLALLRDSAQVAGSHLLKSRKAGTWLAAIPGVTRFTIVHAHPESGYAYQTYPGTGFSCCNPGARYPYTPSTAGAPYAYRSTSRGTDAPEYR